MNKTKLTVLIIDRPTENVVKDIFNVYGEKYGLLVFLPKENKELIIQTVFCDHQLISDMESLFNRRVDYDPDDLPEFFDLDIYEIEEDVFYDILSKMFVISTFKLTEVEKQGKNNLNLKTEKTGKPSFEFLNEADPSFRRKVDGCFVGVASIMDKYRTHVKETVEENQKSPSDFLKEDFLLEMMVKDFDCYESVLHIMGEYSKAVFISKSH